MAFKVESPKPKRAFFGKLLNARNIINTALNYDEWNIEQVEIHEVNLDVAGCNPQEGFRIELTIKRDFKKNGIEAVEQES